MTEALKSLELRSEITAAGKLLLSLVEVDLKAPAPDEVVVRIEASPINPSDLGLLIGPADLSTLEAVGTCDRPALTATIPPQRMLAMQSRIDQSLPVGNEGAGTVISSGENAAALLGRRVGMIGGAMYAQYRVIAAKDCIPLPEGTSAADGASMFVNPLTALGFVETMKLEGHSAIVHSAAASNLGRMLNRICIADGVPLVNIVRSEEQSALLRSVGATWIVDSNSANFQEELIDAIEATGATLGFDAIGGGTMAGTILAAMEVAINRKEGGYSRYGSATLKQVYIYGSLDPSPTILDRSFGMAWNSGGWLLFPFLKRAGPDVAARMRQRVLDELTTTFSSHYTSTIGLRDALNPDVVRAYQRKTTGEKYLIDPTS